MTVEQLIRALQQMPPKANVIITDDGATHLPEWNAGVADVELDTSLSTNQPDVKITFEGFFLRSAIDQDETGEGD